jgi:DNA-binding LacI/PurR family transcriptional regulator
MRQNDTGALPPAALRPEGGANASARSAPGMKDVARLAGGSHQTVSRVLNAHPSVRPDTRVRVLAAVETLGYRPNNAARALVTGRTRVIGVLTISGYLFGPASTLYGVEGAASALGYSVSVVSMRELSAAELREGVGRLMRQGVDGVVVIAPIHIGTGELDKLAAEVPLVALEGTPEGALSVVSIDQVLGARLATAHLLELGHRTVWHVAGPADWFEAADRIKGWRTALAEAGREQPPVLPGDWTARAGYEAGLLLVRLPDVTAVFAANDQMALGVLRALSEHGRRVPDDVSVVGFDDLPESGYFTPPLTTLRQDFAEVGRQGVARLLQQIETGEHAERRVQIAPALVVRQSTAPPHG